MGTQSGESGRGPRRRTATGIAGRCVDRPVSAPQSPLLSPLPPRPSGPEAEVSGPGLGDAAGELAPSWSLLRVAVPLFAAVWICFAILVATVTTPAADSAAGLARLLAIGTAVVGLVLVTLSVAHAQVSGLRPHPAVVGVVGLGAVQGVVAGAGLGSAGSDLWPIAGWFFGLVGVAVPLAWVGGQFQSGVRRRRVERRDSLVASWVARVRHQAHETVDSVHRHDVRSALFVIDAAARTLADPTLSPEQRASFGDMLTEAVQRLSALMDFRTEEIHPFDLEQVTRAVVHAERKAGRAVTSAVPAGLTAVGRAADVAGVLRTLVALVTHHGDGVRLRAEIDGDVVVVLVEPAKADALPLLSGNWDGIRVESFKPSTDADEEIVDLFVATRLLADQGADLWSTPGRTRFAVRLSALTGPSPEESA
ncbi:MAG TPA: hypothetical protein VFE55_00715 [Acidimicrobiia bacterium]|nr:hypothetical protein [Acidimicrobiia bacterium]